MFYTPFQGFLKLTKPTVASPQVCYVQQLIRAFLFSMELPKQPIGLPFLKIQQLFHYPTESLRQYQVRLYASRRSFELMPQMLGDVYVWQQKIETLCWNQ